MGAGAVVGGLGRRLDAAGFVTAPGPGGGHFRAWSSCAAAVAPTFGLGVVALL